ncbi:hypothetical protein FOA43_003884 [Brettanomyces nanus]|uniref:Pre-mRNA-splicing factor CWC21 n=1 Tax=Eeniella nana TaxID=13502 RepID=A0A875S8G3_EENNA|nr:uncharacterized protein FOA43_003884 [Brettanomyces nanus]QPG76495.1 hypothetical protein FOA43_003884 [Brettanomyces nanus]
MSYNGIGLSTPKGTGTNGYVQRNLSDLYQGRKGQSEGKHFLKREQIRQQRERKKSLERSRTELHDEALSEHERKRELEVKVMEYRERLEDDTKLENDNIEELVKTYRETLKKGQGEGQGRNRSRSRSPQREREIRAYNQKVDPFEKPENKTPDTTAQI